MPVPHLIYEQYFDGLILTVTNLMQLQVSQIQELERFAQARRGWFDFDRFALHIEKRLDIEHLEKLFELSGIRVELEEKEREVMPAPQCDTAAAIGFGKYKGEPYKVLPDAYMLWLKPNYYGPERSDVENELARRGL